MKRFYVYILVSQHYGTLYIGMISNLTQRVYQHKNKMVEGFTKQYDVSMLVYYEQHETFESAVTREKQIKAWKRQWKINLIEKENPHWEDFYKNIAALSV
jgi:putative endonuclease